jgi:hypothetical protein
MRPSFKLGLMAVIAVSSQQRFVVRTTRRASDRQPWRPSASASAKHTNNAISHEALSPHISDSLIVMKESPYTNFCLG